MKWEKKKLDDLIDLYDNIRIPLSAMEREKRQGEYPYYGAQSIIDYVNEYLFDGDYILIAEDGENLRTRTQPIAFAVSGQFWVNNHAHIVKGKDNIANDLFIKYFLNNLDINPYVTGAAQPKLSQRNLKAISVPTPPLPTQRKIASILSAYDDLIENNLKRIKLLEEATRYSYKQFKKETINEWILGKFSDYFKINNGCAFKAGWYADSGVPIIRTRDYSYSKFLNVGQPIFIDDFQAENFTKFLLKEYDFMLIMVGASIGRYGIILPKDLPALQNQNQWALREINEYSYLKVIKLLLIEEILETLLQQRTGAARDFFRASFLNELEVRVPPEKSGRELNSILENSFNQINVLQKQNTKLREARDILLPKLMNGQIEA